MRRIVSPFPGGQGFAGPAKAVAVLREIGLAPAKIRHLLGASGVGERAKRLLAAQAPTPTCEIGSAAKPA